MICRAAEWLISVQRDDGGWGEDEESYGDAPRGQYKESTASQTAWALLGLMAAGEARHPATARGIAWLIRTQRDDGDWTELPYTAVGFPRVFYLRYHGYRRYFPLLALARYRNLRLGNAGRVSYGFCNFGVCYRSRGFPPRHGLRRRAIHVFLDAKKSDGCRLVSV
jgi:squalene-hopene/tetraprenyl-beta-curcumene cyclase